MRWDSITPIYHRSRGLTYRGDDCRREIHRASKTPMFYGCVRCTLAPQCFDPFREIFAGDVVLGLQETKKFLRGKLSLLIVLELQGAEDCCSDEQITEGTYYKECCPCTVLWNTTFDHHLTLIATVWLLVFFLCHESFVRLCPNDSVTVLPCRESKIRFCCECR